LRAPQDCAQLSACKQAVTGVAKTRTSWQPGQSGNLRGRPRVDFELREAAREYGPRCIEALAVMAGLGDGPPASAEPVRLGALKELLDRGFGRATLSLEGGNMPVLVDWRWSDATPVAQPTAMALLPDPDGEEDDAQLTVSCAVE
jgi:hypothetical protein